MKFTLSLASALLALSFAGTAEARSFRVKDIPNGNKYGCVSCHTSNSGKTNTAFGNDSEKYLVGGGSKSQRHTDWASLCPLDSDGDGYTNGQELGDPDCTWMRGQANPPGPTSNPGKASSVPAPACGNGKIDPGESCDGSAMSASSCDEIGAGVGLLGCTSKCTFDTTDCSADPSTGTGDVTSGAGGAGGGSASDHYGSTPPVLPTACSMGPGESTECLAPALVCVVAGLTAMRRRSALPR
ncbi:MAG: hypothetical protein U0414_03960 [Polyangiaceae bacterium]